MAARIVAPHPSPLPAWALPAALCVLLAATLWLHLPLMLWDHLDLVPILDAWRHGELGASQFWRLHDGSHFHSAAYAVLLATSWLSGGRAWLDCVASWAFFALMAWTLWRIVADGWRGAPVARGWRWAMLGLIVPPGHLANLQWGWQVAVFISLLGAVAPIRFLTLDRPTHALNLAGVLLAVVGVLDFSTTLGVFPVALALIGVRNEWPWSRRLAFALPWLVAGGSMVAWLLSARGPSAPLPDTGVVALYSLNYLGGGVLRFAEDVAPWWTLLALLMAVPATLRCRDRPQARAWLALMAFAMGCALLTALGRAASFGPAHGFVTRYASFALLFWIGWLGLMVLAWGDAGPAWRRWVRPLLVATLVFAAANGVHLGKKAWTTHLRALVYAEQIRAHYPRLDDALLAQAYGERAAAARERLGLLRQWGFAPFDRDAAPSD